MYNKTNYNNDFSILRLASPVSFSSRISPVCLPSNVSDNYAGEVVFTLYLFFLKALYVISSPMIGSHGHRVGIVGRYGQPDSRDPAGWVYKIVKDVITTVKLSFRR